MGYAFWDAEMKKIIARVLKIVKRNFLVSVFQVSELLFIFLATVSSLLEPSYLIHSFIFPKAQTAIELCASRTIDAHLQQTCQYSVRDPSEIYVLRA